MEAGSSPPGQRASQKHKILVINPNSNVEMTDGMQRLIEGQYKDLKSTTITTYTAPTGPDSINNEDDASETTRIVLQDLQDQHPDLLSSISGFIIACYSDHPLTVALREHISSTSRTIGIFEASVQACASLLGATAETASQDPSEEVSLDSVDAGTGTDKFGIVTTGSYWEPVLTRGVTSILRSLHLPSSLFSKVVSTGLSAAELHTAPKEDVERRMIEATKRLLEDEKVQAVCLGCAGMAGMEVLVRRACVETRGEVEGGRVHVVDGILAGVDILVEGFERR